MSARQRILLVDDEVALQRTVATLLRSGGYDVVISATGHDALRQADEASPDLVVLDLGLPDLDGLEVCRRLRTILPVPIIVLSARTTESEKVAALDLGADDYVTKPFGPEELLARIRVALRRRAEGGPASTGPVTVGGLTIDAERHRVVRDGVEIRLTPKEFELLTLLVAQSRSRPHTPRDPQGHLGRQRRRAARAPVDADVAAPQEDRARPQPATLPAQRAVGGLSLQHQRRVVTRSRA